MSHRYLKPSVVAALLLLLLSAPACDKNINEVRAPRERDGGFRLSEPVKALASANR